MNARRIAAILAALLLVLLSGTGCGKETDLPSTPAHGFEDDSLTGSADLKLRYYPDALPLPEDFSMPPGSPAVALDEKTGAVSVVSESGFGTENHRRTVFTFSVDGALISETEIPGDTRYSLGAAAFSGDTLWYTLCCYEDGVPDTRLCRMDLHTPDAPLVTDTALASLPEMPPDFYVLKMAADGDGDLWLTNNGLTLVYSPALGHIASVSAGNRVSSFAVDPDGRVWACANYGINLGCCAARLSKQTGGYEEILPLDENTRNIAFDRDGALYYDTADGIFCLRKDGDGRAERAQVLNFLSSGIVRSYAGISGIGGENADLMMAVSEESLLFCVMTEEAGLTGFRPVFYRRGGEEAVPEEEVITLQMAFAHELPANIRAEIVRFNRDHPGIQVTTLDYSIYNNDSAYDSGAQKLMIDMLNGIVAPDIVYGASGSTEMLTLAGKHMTRDLTAFLAEDDTVNPDNLFGSVLSYFDDGAGGIWGIAPYFSVHTWIAGPRTADSSGIEENWTIDDFLDYAESLPAGRFIADNAYRGVVFIANLNAQFADRAAGTCSFDSPRYIRYLKLLDRLPSRQAYEAIRRSPGEERYRDGTVALVSGSLSGTGTMLEWESCFATPDYRIVGYPADRDEDRATLTAQHVFAVTKTCASPESAWAFLRTYFRNPREQMWESEIGLSSLKSCFDENVEEMKHRTMVRFADGRWDAFLRSEDIDQEIKAVYGDIPYTVEPVDEAQLGRIRAFLDRPVEPMTEELPFAVRDLIREEITAFLGGVGTAEDCAAKIQSRVSIWLGENR